MKAGNAWHRVSFYTRTTTRDEYGASVETFTNTLNTRGEIRYTGGNKVLSADEIFYDRSMELTIRYRPGLDETMRVTLDGEAQYYEILYMEILGRNESIKFNLSKVND